MARLPRLTVAGYPHHIIQRGNNRQAVFADPADYQYLLDTLAENAAKHRVAINGYVLMGNHFHLVATPETMEGIPQMMQAVGRRYVRHFNNRHARTGTLWEGRYRSTVIQAERYLLACLAYVDLNPVRAGMLVDPTDYRWSSHRHYLGHRIDPLVTTHPLYWELGNTPFARGTAYAELVRAGLTAAEQSALTTAAMQGWALGDENYVAQLQRRTQRRVSRGKAGRPARLIQSVPE